MIHAAGVVDPEGNEEVGVVPAYNQAVSEKKLTKTSNGIFFF